MNVSMRSSGFLTKSHGSAYQRIEQTSRTVVSENASAVHASITKRVHGWYDRNRSAKKTLHYNAMNVEN